MGQRRRLGRGTSAQSLFHRLSETSTPTVVFVLLMFGVFAPHRRRSFKGAAVSSTSSTSSSSSTFLAVFCTIFIQHSQDSFDLLPCFYICSLLSSTSDRPTKDRTSDALSRAASSFRFLFAVVAWCIRTPSRQLLSHHRRAARTGSGERTGPSTPGALAAGRRHKNELAPAGRARGVRSSRPRPLRRGLMVADYCLATTIFLSRVVD